MNKFYITIIFAIIFCMFSETAKAQNDIPELILEETEGGYIIVNWEDTRVEDEFPPQGETPTPPIINPIPVPTQTKPSKGKKVVAKVKKIIRKSLRGGSKKN